MSADAASAAARAGARAAGTRGAAIDIAGPAAGRSATEGLSARSAAGLTGAAVLADLGTTSAGLPGAEARRRLGSVGPNEVTAPRVSLARTAAAQLRNPLLALLLATALLSLVVGERTNAVIILVILGASAGLGTVNDYRAASTAKHLSAIAHRTAVVMRDRAWTTLDAAELVPGDVVRLTTGGVVPADLRLIAAEALTCDESVLTGEALAVEKDVAVAASDGSLSELTGCAFLGTIVRSGSGIGVVIATGPRAEFGRIAHDLQDRRARTAFEHGLREFSGLLATIAATVSVTVLGLNLLLGRGLLDSLLFATAIAVGITPQLLPAVVSTSLANGARDLGRRKVLVKRLAAIEDLGDVDVLVTDKTGTLTTGQFHLAAGCGPGGRPSDRPRHLALLATTLDVAADGSVTGDPLDRALWESSPDSAGLVAARTRLAVLPFDHDRRRVSVLVRHEGRSVLITKGAPEAVLAACVGVSAPERAVVDEQLTGGGRVIAVATRTVPESTSLSAGDECGMTFAGLLVFDDPAKDGVRDSLARLAALDVRVVIATGDSVPAAARLARTVGLDGDALSGADLDGLDDAALGAALDRTTILARVAPEQKARVVRVLQARGDAVAFLGDGVNDALALHGADVGLSVDTAADVARDAADVVLLEKSLDVVAEGITQGRRIFANTIKYVLMGTSSNFGNIVSASAASVFLIFLPMLPSQLLLNNLLYDTGQLTIPTDNVDADQLRRPGQWDIRLIRRFMLVFGPLSSLFDAATFLILLGPFQADAALFRSGWFVESLATQTLVVFAIRTRRVPFIRSRPSLPLAASVVGVVVVAAYLPVSFLARRLGFVAPPASLYICIAAVTVVYLVLVDAIKGVAFAFDRTGDHP